VEAATRALLPSGEPRLLRSAQFAFVGPASGSVTARPTLLRQGKSTLFAAVDLHGDAGLATRAALCFAAGRNSSIAYANLPMPDVPPPEDCPALFTHAGAPAFSANFEAKRIRRPRNADGAREPELTLWIRHRDPAVARDATALVALADAAPPAAMLLMQTPGPISTMTWSLDILADPAAAAPGWTLMRSTAQIAAEGYSTQAMTLWDSSGMPLVSASQNVAIFV
jgi:hypothetical protein